MDMNRLPVVKRVALTMVSATVLGMPRASQWTEPVVLERTRTMQLRPRVRAVQIELDAERRVSLVDLKNGILTLLAIWIGYFLIINFFIQVLDDIHVPYVDMSLGYVLAAQGVVVIFASALVLLLRHQRNS
jgi:putative solute:sodium symporter small subunit